MESTPLLDDRTLLNLASVHPDLVKVVTMAYPLSTVPFVVIHGLRDAATEAGMVAKHASETMHSRHLPNKQGFACAVDVMADPEGKADWAPIDYQAIHAAFLTAAHEANVLIEWGGDWKTLKDLGHFQLPWAQYP
jgi:peptidoglycan L-alanyl-D-glutamate endopeptidase CwlK